MKKNILIIGVLIFLLIGCGSSGQDATLSPYSVETYDVNENATVYETAEDGVVTRWLVTEGPYEVQNAGIGANGSVRSILLRENWQEHDDGTFSNEAFYVLETPNDKGQFNLEFDMRVYDDLDQPCFLFGVKVETNYGSKIMVFDIYTQHIGLEAYVSDWDEMVFPLDETYRFGGFGWRHLTFDLEEYLHLFEPNNQIISVEKFFVRGGDIFLDNIRLTW